MMNNDPRFFRFTRISGTTAPMPWLARVLSGIVGAVVFVVALLAGGVLLLLFLGLALAIAAVLMVRMWWWRRQLPRQTPAPDRSGASHDRSTIEGDYRVVDD